jgi:molybdate transport system substrate-binding protein
MKMNLMESKPSIFVLKRTSLIASAMIVFVISAAALTGCSNTSNTESEPVTINLAAGVGLIDVMADINALYIEQNPHVTIMPTYASAGTLQQQIQNGAPVDVFISPGVLQMDTLQNGALIVNESRKNLLTNTIVLIVPADSTLGITGFEDLTNASITKIAIGDPASVPAGKYGKSALDFYGIYSQLESASKFVLCADVRQVLTYVESDNVDAGIVYATDALISDTVKVVANGPDSVNAKIVYPVAVIEYSEIQDAAQDYEDFLFSDEAGEIFEEYGFTLVEN